MSSTSPLSSPCKTPSSEFLNLSLLNLSLCAFLLMNFFYFFYYKTIFSLSFLPTVAEHYHIPSLIPCKRKDFEAFVHINRRLFALFRFTWCLTYRIRKILQLWMFIVKQKRLHSIVVHQDHGWRSFSRGGETGDVVKNIFSKKYTSTNYNLYLRTFWKKIFYFFIQANHLQTTSVSAPNKTPPQC